MAITGELSAILGRMLIMDNIDVNLRQGARLAGT